MRHRKISSVMTAGDAVVRVSADTPFKEIARLLAARGISAVPVVDREERVIGIVSEADLLAKESRQEPGKAPLFAGRRERVLESKAAGMTAGELMTSPAITIDPDSDVVRAARTMEDRRVKRLVVTDEQGRLVGIVSRRDLIGVFLRSDEEIRTEIAEDVVRAVLWMDPAALDISVAEGVVTLRGEVETWTVADLLSRVTARVDGVVEVLNELTYAHDDRHDHLPDGRFGGILQRGYPGA